jgi:hypothetical protein
MQIFSTTDSAKVSPFRLVLTIMANSFWLLSRSFKIIMILHREMLNHIVKGQQNSRADFVNRNIFHRYGTWFIDMNGLIQEQMGVK